MIGATRNRDRYVYAIEEKYGRMIYVGVGKGDRWAHHLREARRGFVGKSNPAKAEYLILCLECGIELEIYKIAEHLTIDEACKLEREIIELLGRRDLGTGPLLNANAGGFGVNDPAPSTRAKLAEAGRKRMSSPDYSAKMIEAARTPEARAKIANSARKRMESPEFRAMMAAANSTPQARAKIDDYARNRPPSHNENISKGLTGRTLAPEHVAKLAAQVRAPERREKKANEARKQMESPERRAAQSALARKQMESPAHRAKMKDGNSKPESRAKQSAYASNRTPEHTAKLVEALKRRFASPEARSILSERSRKWWAEHKAKQHKIDLFSSVKSANDARAKVEAA